ncbi:MAG: SLC13 family permease, partial [Planctomycetaceae bacterium]
MDFAAVIPWLSAHWAMALTAAVVALTLGLLLFVQRAPDMVMIGGVVILLAAGVITPDEALKGMSNEGMITVAALFVVAAAVERTGALAVIVDRVLGRPKSLGAAQLRTMVGPGVVSAFMNNTPVVALMVPAIRDWARKHRLSVSKLLMPMNAAVVLGGLCTLIGTSTNVVVSGLVAGKRGTPLEMFDITWLGVPLFAVGLVYLVVASRFLLKDRRPPMSTGDDPREYSLEMLVEPGSPLAGRTIEEAGLRHLDGLYLMEIDRGGHVLPAVGPTERLEAGDRLVFVGVI